MEMPVLTHSSLMPRLTMMVLAVGFTIIGAGCPPGPTPSGCQSDADCAEGEICDIPTGQCESAPPAECTSDDDCAEGEVCDVATGQCQAGPTMCTANADCAQGEFCNVQTGDCVLNVNLFATVEFDHNAHMEAFGCATCHHAGTMACDTCHDRDEVVGGVPVLKDAQHNPQQYGCWSCHDDVNQDGTTRDCSFCHTALDEM